MNGDPDGKWEWLLGMTLGYLTPAHLELAHDDLVRHGATSSTPARRRHVPYARCWCSTSILLRVLFAGAIP